jgi:hypothetical protein
MTDSPLDRDLAEMAGTPQLARVVRRSLERLRDGAAGPDLAEMARELLDGRTDLRSVARSTAYAGPITDGIHRYDGWQAQLTAEERRQLEEEMRAIVSDEDSAGGHQAIFRR